MRGYGRNRNCAFCRLMRSLAFTGVGMGGWAGAYLLGASQENIMLTGVFVATVIVFGMQDSKNKKR